MPRRLQRRLVESVVVIGADENSAVHLGPEFEDDSLAATLSCAASVLATLNESSAIYPFEDPQLDPNYPSSAITSGTNAVQKSVDYFEEKKRGGVTHRGTLRSLLGGTRKQKSLKMRSNKMKMVEEPSISNETIDGMPMLCFPRGIQILESPTSESILNLVLTDIKGNRLYASGLCLCRRFRYSPDVGLQNLNECNKSAQANATSSLKQVFVPCFIFVISKYRYYSLFREVLSKLHCSLKENGVQFKKTVEQFSATLTHTPVVAKGCPLILEFQLLGDAFKILPPLPLIETVVDYDLTILFQVLSISDVILLISALLQQKRLLLVSNTPTLTTICCDILILLLAPFHWKFTYVAYLPENLLELLDAPGPVLFGCESKYLDNIECLDEIIVANLNTGTVAVPSSMEVFLPPKFAIDPLTDSLETMEKSFDHYMLSNLEPQNIQSYREKHAEFNCTNQRIILSAFTVFMVDLFRGVLSSMKHRGASDPSSKIYFNTESFLKAQSSAKPFYSAITKLEIFDSFLRDRFLEKADAWSYVEEKTRGAGQRFCLPKRISLMSLTSMKSSDQFDLQSNSSMDYLSDLSDNSEHSEMGFNPILSLKYFNIKGCRVLQLPPMTTVDFLEKLIILITATIEDNEIHFILKSNLVLLRIDIQQALGHNLKALKDLYEFSKKDVKLEFKSQIVSLVDSLNDMEKITCYSDPCYHEMMKRIEMVEPSGSSMSVDESHSRILKQFVLPKEPTTIDEFIQIIDDAEITSEIEVAEMLFASLTLEEKLSVSFRRVSPKIIADFYEHWNQDIEEDNAEFKDEIIKKSSVVRVDPIGSGQLILTHESLWLAVQGGSEKRHLLYLTEITSVTKEYSKLKMLASSSTILKIHSKTSPTITLWLKLESRYWEVLINEMRAGQIMANDMKDGSLTERAVDNCVILEAIFDCVRSELKYFSNNLKQIVLKMAYFSSSEGTHRRLSRTTLEHLHCKLRSSPNAYKDNSVEAMAFVGENQVWVSTTSGHRSNRLVLFDVDTMSINTEISSMSKYHIMCMAEVSDGTLWVGSQNCRIYIIDVREKTLIQELIEHQNLVLAMASSESGELLVSGCPMGEVILWKTSSRTKLRSWKLEKAMGVLQLSIQGNYIYSTTQNFIFIYDLGGSKMASISSDRNFTSSTPKDRSFECHCIFQDYLYIGMSRKCRLNVYSLQNPENPSRIGQFDLTTNESSCAKSSTVPCKDCKSEKGRCSKCRIDGCCRGLSRILAFNEQLWACCKDGNIFVFDLLTQTPCHKLEGHPAAIQSICGSPNHGLIFTGGRNDGGKIAVWNAKLATTALDPISNIASDSNNFLSLPRSK